ncbi:two-component sensor histidine kinase [Elizabethkingia anophelis]|nr:two-component sensor histidine kinase [Elizabethkingia anophelis]PRQ86199.1 two-component sensor histidine kinase [Elizabethkingia anophelis]
MTIKRRFILITSTTFGIFSILIFWIFFILFHNNTKSSYFKHLQHIALLTGNYYLEKDEMPDYKYNLVKKEYDSLISNYIVSIYNQDNNICYGSPIHDSNITAYNLNQVRKNDYISFTSGRFLYYGIYYPDNQGDFVVIAKISDYEFKSLIYRVLIITVIAIIICLFGIYLLSSYLSKIIYKPISQVVKAVNNSSYNNIANAITNIQSKDDEIGELITSYNKLLTRISENIIIQQNFINYISHEFKTPLMSISGNLEVFSLRDRTPEEYNKVVKDVLGDVYKIEDILNNLLLASGLSRNQYKNKDFSLRIDEIIWNIYSGLALKVSKLNSQIKIDIQVVDSNLLSVSGNETLLYLALYNMIENAVKYAPSSVIKITLTQENYALKIIIEDKGIGMSSKDLERIFDTFHRGTNVKEIQGSGIGMSLVKNILEYHHIEIIIKSVLNEGTRISLYFPHKNSKI